MYGKYNAEVLAIGDGTVFKVTEYGPYVLHTLPNGEQITTIYGHVVGLKDLVGKQVKKGDAIGILGSPQWASKDVSIHIHFEAYQGKIESGAPSSKVGKGDIGTGGRQILPNDKFLINPLDLLGKLLN